jgi:hypothetical protein
MQIPVRDKFCPRCHAPINVATVDPHPTRADIVHHNFECMNCGPVGTTISLCAPRSRFQRLDDVIKRTLTICVGMSDRGIYLRTIANTMHAIAGHNY